MLILAAAICLQARDLTVECRSQAMRVERTPEACQAMLAPVLDLAKTASAGLPVVYLVVGCKLGLDYHRDIAGWGNLPCRIGPMV